MSLGASFIYTLTDGVRNIKENFFTTLFSALTVGFTLTICSVFLIVFINLNSVLSKWGERTHIIAYLDSSTVKTGKDVEFLKAEVGKIVGVMSVTYVSKKDALKILTASLKGYEGLLDGLEGNPLPASIEVLLSPEARTPKSIESIAETIGGLSGVDELQYGTEWVEKLSAILGFIQLAVTFLGLFLALATLFIISNTIRLTIYARRDEVEVMLLVGASNSYIKLPFFFEGLVAGLAGGVSAFVILSGVRFVLVEKMPPYLTFVLDSPVSEPHLLLALVLIGALIGGLGSLLSLGRFLKV